MKRPGRDVAPARSSVPDGISAMSTRSLPFGHPRGEIEGVKIVMANRIMHKQVNNQKPRGFLFWEAIISFAGRVMI